MNFPQKPTSKASDLLLDIKYVTTNFNNHFAKCLRYEAMLLLKKDLAHFRDSARGSNKGRPVLGVGGFYRVLCVRLIQQKLKVSFVNIMHLCCHPVHGFFNATFLLYYASIMIPLFSFLLYCC